MARREQRRASFEDISSYTSNRAVRKNKKRKKKTGLLVLLSIVFALLIILGSGMIYVSAFAGEDPMAARVYQSVERTANYVQSFIREEIAA